MIWLWIASFCFLSPPPRHSDPHQALLLVYSPDGPTLSLLSNSCLLFKSLVKSCLLWENLTRCTHQNHRFPYHSPFCMLLPIFSGLIVLLIWTVGSGSLRAESALFTFVLIMPNREQQIFTEWINNWMNEWDSLILVNFPQTFFKDVL